MFQPSEELVFPSGVTFKSLTPSCFFLTKTGKNICSFLGEKKELSLEIFTICYVQENTSALIHLFSGELSYRVSIMSGTFQSFNINKWFA